MDNIIYTNRIITYRGYGYTYESCDKIDDACVHVNMSGGTYAFVGGETTINNILQPDADTIIATLLAG